MKKQLAKIIMMTLLISCSNDIYITDEGIGQFKLGGLLEREYSKEDLDITVDSNNRIRTIIVNSNKFKTKEGFGVGSDIDSIKNAYKPAVLNENQNVSKDNVPIIDLGASLTYNKIIFIDQNRDGKIDYVLLHNDTI